MITSKCVGGEFLIEKMIFIEKLIVIKASGITHSISRIDECKIAKLVDEVKENR